MSDAPELTSLHPDLEPLAFLLGIWQGHGNGEYPTVPPFHYGEEARFWHVGKPFLAYSQITWDYDSRVPMHAETGYFRTTNNGENIEIVIAHPSGIVEIQEGALTGTHIDAISTTVATTTTAKLVRSLTRKIDVQRNKMTYELEMAAVGETLHRHLKGWLRRVPD